MPKAHADGTVTNAGLELEAAPSAARMTVAEYLTPPPAAQPAAAADLELDDTEGGEPSSPDPGTDSSPSAKKPRTNAATNAGGPRRRARNAGNR
jgi:hypothetical protein